MNIDPPPAFDWRDVDGRSYIGPVRDQGGCGSCYAFSAAAAAEGAYNKAHGLTNEQCADFSEAFIIWCLGSLPPYEPHFWGCDGADYAYAELQALADYGLTHEIYYPYTGNPPAACVHWTDPSIRFQGWGRVDCGDIEGVKTAILTRGVVDAAVLTSSGFDNYAGGIYKDSLTTCPDGAYTETDHAVALVGWGRDEVEGDYFILRNSWGDGWGEKGYMRIKPDAAYVSCAVAYLETGEAGEPEADFFAMSGGGGPVIVRAGETLVIRDATLPAPAFWQWEITPLTGVGYGLETGAASQHVAVVFSQAGDYSVSLAVSNVHGGDVRARDNWIRVVDSDAVMRGDVNNDLDVDLKDAVLAGRVSAGYPLEVHALADVNGDHRIGLAEMIHAIRRSAGF